jgi:FkbM family methyltransferase
MEDGTPAASSLLLQVVGTSGLEKAAEDYHESKNNQGAGTPRADDASEWRTIKVFTGSHEALGKTGQMHSQAGQDWLVATLLGCKREGWFVDLAANDAKTLSNTLMLERDFAWNGLCIEANMNYMYGLTHRQCKVVSAAVGTPRDEEVTFTMRGVYGGIVGDDFDNKNADHGDSVKLRTVPLGDVFAEMNAPSTIDYLSLDVEGAESIVMQGFPWDKYHFSVITVERPKPDLQKLLTGHGYKFLRKNSKFDDETWISTTMPNFTELMQTWGLNRSGDGLQSKVVGSSLETGMRSSPTSCMIQKGYALPANSFLAVNA